jgi:hypothetical protein
MATPRDRLTLNPMLPITSSSNHGWKWRLSRFPRRRSTWSASVEMSWEIAAENNGGDMRAGLQKGRVESVTPLWGRRCER